MRRARGFASSWVALAIAVVVSIFAGLSCAEGLSSFALFFWDLARSSPAQVAESRYTGYDPLLGWVGLPNRYVGDMYGPGVYLRTNARGLRANEDVPAQVPVGHVRAVCSGDSFTLGYGVDNDHTWCQLLKGADARLETVNLGQGGYGLDQAFLMYEREARSFDHQLQLFAFITTDFKRMRSASFLGYPKPTLELERGELVVRNLPVPRREPSASWLARLALPFGDMRSAQLLQRIGQSGGASVCRLGPQPDAKHWPTVAAVFRAARDLNRERGSRLVLVYLPTRQDYWAPCADPWREKIRAQAESEGIALVDLVGEFRRLPPAEIDSMFIPKGALDYRGASGHYSVTGNRWVASALYERLVSESLLPQQRAFAAAASTPKPRGAKLRVGRSPSATGT